MKLQYCFVLIWLALAKAQDDTRVVGGTNAALGEHPYQVSLKDASGNHLSGGGIICNRWVLTCATCIATCPTSIATGSITLVPAGTLYIVDGCFPHPNHNPSTRKNNIALIRTKSEIVFNDNVQPIALANFVEWPGATLVFQGWGRTTAGGPLSNILQKLSTNSISSTACQSMLPAITLSSDEMCTQTTSGHGICFGDTGNILSLRGAYAIAINTRGVACSFPRPDVHTYIRPFLFWIKWVKYVHAY